MNIKVEPDWGAPPGGQAEATTVASGQGAGPLGFGGATHAEAAGLTTLVGAEFGGGPQMPMTPSTWQPDPPREAGDVGDHG